MSRLAIWVVCLTVLNGISGCACCSCCNQMSGGYSSRGNYAMADDYYPMDGGYDSGAAGCGCSGGGTPTAGSDGYDPTYADMGQGIPMTSRQYRSNSGQMSRSGMVAPQEYASYNPSPKLIQPMRRQAIPANSQNPYAGNVQQAGMSTWEQSPDSGGIVQQSYQRPAPCNCGR